LNSTRTEILSAFDKIIHDARPKDTFVFSYSGQGVNWESGQPAVSEYYLMPSDFGAQANISGGRSINFCWGLSLL
jgi:uncharacterized caspase-like protein